MTAQQKRVLIGLLQEAERKLWLAQTSIKSTEGSVIKHSERVDVLRQLIALPVTK